MKRSKAKRILYVADFETTPFDQYKIEGETRVYLYEMKDVKNTRCYLGLSIDDFMNDIYTLEDGAWIYFHNLSFDGEFLLWYLMRHGYRDIGKIDDVKREAKTMETIITETSTIFTITIISPDYKRYTFRCSYRLFPESIEKIGKMVGLEKLHETHNYEEIKNYEILEDVPQEELMYLDHDVEILRRLIEFLDSLEMLNISSSTNAYKTWKKANYNFVKYNLVKPQDDTINEFIDKSYRGGLTMVNKKYQGVLLGQSQSFDVNSLYPSVMFEDMPYGEGEYYENVNECKLPLKIICVYILSAKIKQGYIPFIPNSRGFSFSCSYEYDDVIEEKFIYLWEEEFKLFKECYDGFYQVTSCVGFKRRKNMFKDYLDHWGHEKENAEKDSPWKQFCKNMMNHFYGKFGMNSHRYSRKPERIDDDEIIYKIDESDTFYYYRPIASIITSKARCKLISAMILFKDRFIYCDTDSIYLTGWSPAIGLPVDDKLIGYWKHEHNYNHFKALKAKCYLKDWTNEKGEIEYDSSIAGLPKDCRSTLTYETLEDGFEVKNAKKCKVKVKGGIVITKIPFKIKVKGDNL